MAASSFKCRCWNFDQTLVMKKNLQLFLEQAIGRYIKKYNT